MYKPVTGAKNLDALASIYTLLAGVDLEPRFIQNLAHEVNLMRSCHSEQVLGNPGSFSD